MAKILLIALVLMGCKKSTEPQCYICTFGTIQVNGTGPKYSSPEEIHCEPGADSYKKFLTVPGTVINNWQLPTSCKLVK